MPLSVAVVVPTHQRPRALERAVTSVIGQTCRPDEVVVVDDAADPATRATVRRLRDAHALSAGQLRYIENRNSGGASSSRNLGVASTWSDVVALLDDDDFWAPTHLCRALSEMERTTADLTVTWRTGALDDSLRPYLNPSTGLVVRQVIARNPGVVGSNICVRRDAYQRIGGFDEALPVSNDLDFFVRFLQHGLRYTVVDEPLVFVGNESGPRLIQSDARRVDGLNAYFAKHRRAMAAPQRLEMRRRVLRARVRMLHDGVPRGVRRFVLKVPLLMLSRPQGRHDLRRLLTLLRDV